MYQAAEFLQSQSSLFFFTCSLFCHLIVQNSCLTAGQHNDPGASTSVPKHLAQTFFLIWSQNRSWLQVYVDVRVDGVIAKVVLSKQRVLQLDAAFLQHFNHLLHHIREEHNTGVSITFWIIFDSMRVLVATGIKI